MQEVYGSRRPRRAARGVVQCMLAKGVYVRLGRRGLLDPPAAGLVRHTVGPVVCTVKRPQFVCSVVYVLDVSHMHPSTLPG